MADRNGEFKEYRRAQNRRGADRKAVMDRGNDIANGRMFTPYADISEGIGRPQPKMSGEQAATLSPTTVGIAEVLKDIFTQPQRPATGPIASAHRAFDAQADAEMDSFMPKPAYVPPSNPDGTLHEQPGGKKKARRTAISKRFVDNGPSKPRT